MLSLSQLQGRMAGAILSGDAAGLEAWLAEGPVGAAQALDIHRGTAIGGLTNALRLTFPTVDWLVGGDFFDQAARAFIGHSPPRSVFLGGYGAGFPEFLGRYELAASLPYLADAARLDLALEAAGSASASAAWRDVDLGSGVVLQLDRSLRVLRLSYPVHLLRDAFEAGQEGCEAFGAVPSAYALWRGQDGPALRTISGGSAMFLGAVLAGQPADQAAETALAEAGDGALSSLQSEVFQASFARLIPSPESAP